MLKDRRIGNERRSHLRRVYRGAEQRKKNNSIINW